MNTPETAPVFESISAFVDEHYGREAAFVDQRFHVGDETLNYKEDAPMPTLEEVKAALVSLSKSQLETIRNMENPVLQFVPQTAGERYIEAFGSTEVEFSFGASVALALDLENEKINIKNKRIVGWNAAVTEGKNRVTSDMEKMKQIAKQEIGGEPTIREIMAKLTQNLQGKTMGELGIDNSADILGRRVDCFNQRCEEKGISGADMRRHMLLMMRVLDQVPARPIDDDFNSTLFCRRVGQTVIYGYWDQREKRVVFSESCEKDRLVSGHFRPSVMVNVPQSCSAPQEEPCGAAQASARNQISQAAPAALDDKK